MKRPSSTTARSLAAGLAIASTLAAAQAVAGAFWPGTVINIASNDVLNIRKWPASTSQLIGAQPDGSEISLTGTCKNRVTNVSFRIDGSQSANWKYNRMKKPNVWCQVMTVNAKLGWARGAFIWPE
jgi:hypothetical protein